MPYPFGLVVGCGCSAMLVFSIIAIFLAYCIAECNFLNFRGFVERTKMSAEKWTVGSQWKLRGGKKGIVIAYVEELSRPLIIRVLKQDFVVQLGRNGEQYVNKSGSPQVRSVYDIIGPWQEELKVEVGGIYETRDGRKVYIDTELPLALGVNYRFQGYISDKHGAAMSADWAETGACSLFTSGCDLVRRLDESTAPVRYCLEKTECFPNSYKLLAIGCVPNNSPGEFFPTEQAALAEIERRNGVLAYFCYLRDKE